MRREVDRWVCRKVDIFWSGLGDSFQKTWSMDALWRSRETNAVSKTFRRIDGETNLLTGVGARDAYLPSLLAPKASEASKGDFYWCPAVRSGSCNWVCYRGSSEMCQIHTQWSHFSEVNLCIFTMCIFAKCTRLTHLLSFASLGEKSLSRPRLTP